MEHVSAGSRLLFFREQRVHTFLATQARLDQSFIGIVTILAFVFLTSRLSREAKSTTSVGDRRGKREGAPERQRSRME